MFVCIGHRDNTLARCDSIFPLLRCQGVWNKTCSRLSLSQILFQNPNNYSLGDVRRFCYHSWCDSTVIFDQSATVSTFTTVRVDFGRPSLSSSSTSSLPSQNPFAPILVFLLQIDQLWNKILWHLSAHFRHPWSTKKTDFTRQVITRTLSKINKRNSILFSSLCRVLIVICSFLGNSPASEF